MLATFVTREYGIGMSDIERLVTSEELESRFETDRPFSEEPVAQSLGRLAWISTRGSAEFLLTLQKLGLTNEQVPDIMEALGELQTDYYDFVLVGLESDRTIDRDGHPLEGIVADLIDEITDTIEDQIAYSEDVENPKLFPTVGEDIMMDFGIASTESLLQSLQSYKDTLQ